METRFICVKIKQLWFADLEGFILYVSQRRKEALNECSYLCFFWNWLWILIDFRFADLRIIRISAFPVYASSCIWPCRAGWIERIVALKSQFSDQKSNLLSWFYDSRENSYLWLVLPSYLPRNVTHSFTCFECLVVSTGFKYGRIPAVSKAH